MNIDYPQMFELQYWFSANPGFLSDATAIGFAIFFGLFFVAWFLLFRYAKFNPLDKPQRIVAGKVKTMLLMMGFIGYVLLFFSYQAVPLLSMRFLFLVWGLGAILWTYLIWHFATTAVPHMRDAIQKKEQMAKYTLRKKPA